MAPQCLITVSASFSFSPFLVFFAPDSFLRGYGQADRRANNNSPAFARAWSARPVLDHLTVRQAQ